MSGTSQEPTEEELPANHTGPKGVINDWRRFKLDTADENTPPTTRELLRQMSCAREDDKERVLRKMSAQEYELIKEEDGRVLKRYRKQRMQEMHERLSMMAPTFDGVHELESGDEFLEAIEKEHHLTTVVVHIYQPGVKGCEELNSCLDCLAIDYSSVKFCRIDAVATGAAERFSSDVLPALLVYKAGELLGNFLPVTKHFNEEFFATDVEEFLNEYGLLPEKDFTQCHDDDDDDDDDEEEADVE